MPQNPMDLPNKYVTFAKLVGLRKIESYIGDQSASWCLMWLVEPTTALGRI